MGLGGVGGYWCGGGGGSEGSEGGEGRTDGPTFGEVVLGIVDGEALLSTDAIPELTGDVWPGGTRSCWQSSVCQY